MKKWMDACKFFTSFLQETDRKNLVIFDLGLLSLDALLGIHASKKKPGRGGGLFGVLFWGSLIHTIKQIICFRRTKEAEKMIDVNFVAKEKDMPKEDAADAAEA